MFTTQGRVNLFEIILLAEACIAKHLHEAALGKFAKFILKRLLGRHNAALHLARHSQAKVRCLGAEHDIARQRAGNLIQQTCLKGFAERGVRHETAPRPVELDGHLSR